MGWTAFVLAIAFCNEPLLFLLQLRAAWLASPFEEVLKIINLLRCVKCCFFWIFSPEDHIPIIATRMLNKANDFVRTSSGQLKNTKWNPLATFNYEWF